MTITVDTRTGHTAQLWPCPRRTPRQPKRTPALRSHDCACAQRRKWGERRRGEDAPGESAQARRGRKERPETPRNASGARRLVRKLCRVGGEFFLFPSQRVRLVSEASALFLLVEACGNDVDLTRSTQAAQGSLCRGFTQMKVRLLSNSHFPSSADSPTPQIHILSLIMIFSVWPRLLRSTFWLLGRGGSGVSNNADKPVRLRDSRGRLHRGSGTLLWVCKGEQRARKFRPRGEGPADGVKGTR